MPKGHTDASSISGSASIIGAVLQATREVLIGGSTQIDAGVEAYAAIDRICIAVCDAAVNLVVVVGARGSIVASPCSGDYSGVDGHA